MGIGAVGAAQAFEYLYDLSAISIIIIWIIILGTYLRFYYGCKVQGIDRNSFRKLFSDFYRFSFCQPLIPPPPPPPPITSFSRPTAYKAPFQPYASWMSFFFLILVLLFSDFTVFMNGQWDTASFVTNYLVSLARIELGSLSVQLLSLTLILFLSPLLFLNRAPR